MIKNIAPLPWERGRGNGSFPVAEALKPLGFKNILRSKIFGGGAMLDFLAGEKLPGIVALKNKKK
jgi:3-phosphoglycerate kinase